MKTMKNVSFKLMMLLAFGASLLITSCESEEDDPIPLPVAAFSVSNLTPVAGEEITFTSNATEATTYQWAFGDGGTSTEESPSHTYSSEGSFTVTFSVVGEGGTATSDTLITVGYPNVFFTEGVFDATEGLVTDYNIYKTIFGATNSSEEVTNYPDESSRHLPIALSNDGTRIYYLDNYNGDLFEAGIDGSGEKTIVTGVFYYPSGLALDAEGNIYVTDRGDDITGEGAVVYKVTPAGVATVLYDDADLEVPTAIAIDQATGDIYVNDVGAEDSGYAADGIWKGNTSGSALTKVITGGGYSIAIGGGNLYYNDAFSGENMAFAPLSDLSSPTKYADLVEPRAYGLCYFGGKVYWTDLGADYLEGSIKRANADGSGTSTLLEGLVDPRAVLVF